MEPFDIKNKRADEKKTVEIEKLRSFFHNRPKARNKTEPKCSTEAAKDFYKLYLAKCKPRGDAATRGWKRRLGS